MSKELKTCPFCGERAVMKAVNKEYGFTIWCQCRKCGARTEGYCPDMNHEDNTITSIEECKDRAAKVWNNRAESANETAEGGEASWWKNMRKKMCALTANIMKPVENQNDL